MWPLRLVVRTLPSQGSNTGSSPVGVSNEIYELIEEIVYDTSE